MANRRNIDEPISQFRRRAPDAVWTPFQNEQYTLKAEVREFRRGQRQMRVELTRPKDRKAIKRYGLKDVRVDFSTITYQELPENGVLLAGLYVARELRGAGLGKQFYDYFRDRMHEEGLRFFGTGRIHKPILALLMKREGLLPYSDQIRAEILPQDAPGNLATPRIRFLTQDLPSEMVVDRSMHGKFYEVVPAEEVKNRPVNLDNVVSLHTGYRNPSSN